MSEREERMGQAEHRHAMLDGVSGRVVELGAGGEGGQQASQERTTEAPKAPP